MRLALTDPLTGPRQPPSLPGAAPDPARGGRRRRGEPLTVCLFDLDDFKQINDRYGHPVGDRCSRTSRASCARLGEAYRLGGDEFAVVFPRERADAAAAAAEEARARRSARRSWEQGGPLDVTAGIATYPDHTRRPQRARARRRHRALLGEGRGQEPGLRLPPGHARRHAAAAAHARAGPGGAAPGGRGARELRSTPATRSRAATRPGSAISPPAIAARLGLPEEEIELIRLAGRLHDIGKLAVPEEILRKPRPAHAARAGTCSSATRRSATGCCCRSTSSPCRRGCCTSTSAGTATGVPSQLAGERIPLGARIIFAADAWDAMTNARPVQPGPVARPRRARRSCAAPARSSTRSSSPRCSRRSRLRRQQAERHLTVVA